MTFYHQKKERLQHVDLSRKGSIDEFITDAVHCINSIPNYFTTSSCSGRIIIVESSEMNESTGTPKLVTKQGCKWLYVSHDKLCLEAVEESLSNVNNEAVFKFEPMIMHIQCQSLQDAQALHHAAVAAGFRNSGISVGNKGKIIVAVRSSHGLEVPLSVDGVILVSKQYLSFLVDCANRKMDENFSRINRFTEGIKLLAEKPSLSPKDDKSNTNKKPRIQMAVKDMNTKEKTKKEETFEEKDEDIFDQDLSLFVFDKT